MRRRRPWWSRGEKREYLILKIAHGEMTLSVPTDKAEEVGMRPPISAEDVDDLFQLLGKKESASPPTGAGGSRTTRRS